MWILVFVFKELSLEPVFREQFLHYVCLTPIFEKNYPRNLYLKKMMFDIIFYF